MEYIKERAVILKGRISNHISDFIKEFKPGYDKGFDLFSDEDILYALLEYSKYPRPYDKKKRIRYIYDKCVEFSNKGLLPTEYTVELEIEHDDESWFIVSKNNPLPF